MTESQTRNLYDFHAPLRMDAEHYQSKYLDCNDLIRKTEHTTLREIVERCKKGIFDIKAETYSSHGIPFIRISDLKNGLIDDDNIEHIPEEVHKEETATEFKEGDVLLSKTAYPAASLITMDKCNISQDIIGISLKESWKRKLHSSFLVAYLNSKYGMLQMEQWFQGNIQMHLALSDARKVYVPLVNQRIQSEISETYSKSKDLMANSKSLYYQAEHVLLEMLGLTDFAPRLFSSFKETLSSIFRAKRLDAEHFQPHYDMLVQHIQDRDHCRLREVQIFNHRGVQPEYDPDGEARVVTSKHLGSRFVNYENLERTSLDEWEANKNARVVQNDILIYTTGAYVGRTNCWLEDGKALASNHINVLRLREIDQIYASVFLNSLLGQLQVQKYASGSAQAELYPSDISQFLMWVASDDTQRRIASLVRNAHRMRKQAINLLKTATAKVEKTVEELVT